MQLQRELLLESEGEKITKTYPGKMDTLKEN